MQSVFYLNVVITIIIEELFFLRGPGLNVTLLSCPADIRGVESRECLCVLLGSPQDFYA